MVMVKNSNGPGGGIGILVGGNCAIGFTTIFIAAAWAVLGPESYLKRLYWTHLLVAIVGLGYFAGLLGILPAHAWNDSPTGLTPVMLFVFGIAPISFAAQLPFWFFRAFFGWQFTFGSSPPAESFSLRDIFVFTFLAAMSFAGPQMAAKQIELPSGYDPAYSFEEVTQPDGTSNWERVVTTDQQVINERLLNHRRQTHSRIFFGYFVAAAWAFAISLLSFPAILLTFRPQETSSGCGLMVGYVLAWSILLTALTFSLFGGGGPPGEIVATYVFFLFAYGGLISILLTMSRGNGFRLTSHRRYRKENSVSQEEKDDPKEA